MLHTKFQTSGLSGFEEEDFLIYFYAFPWFNLGPPGAGPFQTWDLHLFKIGKGPLGNATYGTEFQASKPRGSEGEAF